MDRNQAKEFYPILQAYAEGSVIECRTKPTTIKGTDVPNDWTEMKEIEFWNNIEYRIKQEPKDEFNKKIVIIMEKDELHSALLYLMQKVAEIKDSQMQDKRFVTAVTTVLRHFRDNGELRQAYDLHKVSVADVEKSSWCKILMTLCNTKMDEFGTEIPPIDIKATLEKLNSDEYIDQQIKDVLGDNVADKENKE